MELWFVILQKLHILYFKLKVNVSKQIYTKTELSIHVII